MRTRTLVLAALIALPTAVLAPASPASAEGAPINGSGSTWSQPAVEQWARDVRLADGVKVQYSGVGSSSGRQFFLIDQYDFAVSEIPFEPEEVAKLRSKGKTYQYLPIVAGGTSLMYNLKDRSGRPITDLRLSSATMTAIFTGQVKTWDDPRVTADNAGRVLPATTIIPVVRSDGSGTSAQFTAFMASASADRWRAFTRERGIDPGATSNYPEFPGSVSQRGSDGVANYVANNKTGNGSITYVETAYAIQRGRPVASLRNASGNYTQPTSDNVALALTRARLNADNTQELGGVYNAPDKAAYAMSSYSYMITQTSGLDPAKGESLGRFILHFACVGQQKAEKLGYSPLPPNLVQTVFAAVRRIPGAPTPPALKACNNPTITGRKSGGAPVLVSAGNGTAAAGGGRTTAVPTGSGGKAASGTSSGGAGLGTLGGGGGVAGGGTTATGTGSAAGAPVAGAPAAGGAAVLPGAAGAPTAQGPGDLALATSIVSLESRPEPMAPYAVPAVLLLLLVLGPPGAMALLAERRARRAS